MDRPELSVAIPLYRERETLPELHRRLLETLLGLDLSFEIVFVDDGSDDGQWDLLARYAREDPRIRAVRLARNFGLQAAATAALAETRGRAVVLMDGDLQDPPELIPSLVAKWREGFEVVAPVKETRPEGIFKRLAFAGFYRVFRSLADVKLDAHSGLFSLMDRKVIDALVAFPERGRYLPGLRAWTGFEKVTVPFEREKRFAGRGQSMSGLFRMAGAALLSHSKVPLRAAIVMGLFLVSVSILGIGAIVVLKFVDPEMISGWASQMVTVIFIGAIQLLFLGVLAEYLGRIYDEVKGRPVYLISQRAQAAKQPPEHQSVDTAATVATSATEPDLEGEDDPVVA